MGPERRSLLFCPPLPPVELAPGECCVIGRARDCTLTLAATAVSRRHSEIYSEGGGFRVRDLESTNGTFVNGERVEDARLLRAGDRIEIGTHQMTYCVVDARMGGPLPHAHESETQLVPTHARETVRGDLAQIPIFAVLQMLELGHKTGCLEIDGPDGRLALWLGSGRPIHAESKHATGLEAAFEVAACRSGGFAFESAHEPDARTIEASIIDILLEGARLADERG